MNLAEIQKLLEILRMAWEKRIVWDVSRNEYKEVYEVGNGNEHRYPINSGIATVIIHLDKLLGVTLKVSESSHTLELSPHYLTLMITEAEEYLEIFKNQTNT